MLTEHPLRGRIAYIAHNAARSLFARAPSSCSAGSRGGRKGEVGLVEDAFDACFGGVGLGGKAA